MDGRGAQKEHASKWFVEEYTAVLEKFEVQYDRR
jgi:hypothetical protein